MTTDAAPVTLTRLLALKRAGTPIVCLTAYDASFAAILDQAGVDLVLVGDSLGMVVQGRDSTLPVTMDHMVYHCACVARGCRRPLRVGDMPFMSYATPERALANATRLMQEGDMQMVKLEGGMAVLDSVDALVSHGIPVCGHLGLQPQSVHQLGGYRVQGRTPEQAEALKAAARALEAAGASLLVLECVPRALAAEITAELRIPTIGIGAGPDTDGQVLVLYDMLGVTRGHRPRFVQDFLAGAGDVEAAVRAFAEAVRARRFPGPDQSF